MNLRRIARTITRSPITPIIIGVVVLLGPALIPGRALYWGTASLQFIPWRITAWQQIQNGVLPLWNDLSGMGAPLLANYQSALLYPPGWLTFLLDAIAGTSGLVWGFGLLMAGHLIWGGIGMSRLMKRLGMSEVAQMIAGLSFALCSYWVARGSFFSMIWTGSWLPWIILYASDIANPVEGIVNRGRIINLRLVVCLAFQLLAGHAQLTWYSFLLAAVWVFSGIFRTRGWKIKLFSISRLAIAGLLAIGLACIQLIPTAEYLLNSQRASAYEYQQAMTFSFWPWRLLTLLMPNMFGSPGYGNYWGYAAYWEDAIYIGLIPFFLALGTLPRLFKKKEQDTDPQQGLIRFAWIVIGVIFLLALGKNTPIYPWLYRNIPTFAMFQAPTRWLVWDIFLLILLAGVTADRWQRKTGRRARRVRQGMVAAAAVVLGAVIGGFLLTANKGSTFFPAAAIAGVFAFAFGLISQRAPKKDSQPNLGWSWLIAGIMILDLGAANWGLNPTTRADFYTVENQVLQSTKMIDDARIYIPPEDEYSIKFGKFVRFTNTGLIGDIQDIRKTELPNLNLLDGVPSANNFDPLIPARYALIMDRLQSLSLNNQKLLLERMNVGWLIQDSQSDSAKVSFTRLQPLGQVQWRGCGFWVENMEEAAGQLQASIDGSGFQNRVILEGNPSGKTNKQETCEADGQVGNLQYKQISPVQISATIEADHEGWVVLAEAWYPGWKAFVDGAEVENIHADVAFQAVHILPGRHTIEWHYRSTSFTLGALISGISLILMIIFVRWPAAGRNHTEKPE